MNNKKYELTNDIIFTENGEELRRIICIKSFDDVKKGDLGGYIHNHMNLSDNAWVYDNAKVYGKARLYQNAKIYDNVVVEGNARVSGTSILRDNVVVNNNGWVYGNVEIKGNVKVTGWSSVCAVIGSLELGGGEVIKDEFFSNFKDIISKKNGKSGTTNKA